MGHYHRRIKELIAEYNRPFPGPYYFTRFFTHKHLPEVKIADLGSGPICTLGTLWGHIKITIFASDIQQPEYAKILTKENCTPLVPIEYQDMENLTYPDNFFDLVHCVNAIDHTQNIEKALSEMYRVCKPNGYIYLRHARNQRRAHRGIGHFWDAKINGFSNGRKIVSLDGYTTTDDGYFIVSILQK